MKSAAKVCESIRLRPMLIILLAFAAAATKATPVNAMDCPQQQTMRPVLRGQECAVTSMKAEATEAARQILQSGGNAFVLLIRLWPGRQHWR